MGIEKKCVQSGRTYRIYAPADLKKNWLVSVNNAEGKRIKRIYKYEDIYINRFDSFDERMKAAKRIIDLLIDDPKDQKEKFKTYREQAMGWMLTQPWRKKSFSSYRSIYRVYFDFIGDQKPDVNNTKRFMDEIRVTKYNTTYNNYRRKLKRILENIGYPVMGDIKKIREHRRPSRYYQRSQIDVLKPIMSTEWPDLLLFCQLQYYCFIRPTEIRKLKAQHILLDNEQILIVGDTAKNLDSEYIVIPDQLVPILQYVKELDPNSYLFPGVYDDSKPIGENTMWRRHNDILKRLNFGNGYDLYSWKHTGAVNYIQNGGNVVQLSRQMRHKSLDQTMEYLRQLGVTDLNHLKANIPDM